MNRFGCFALGLIACLSTPCFAQEGIVRIGVAAPLTGPIAHVGLDMANGARLAVEELNASGVTLNGRRYRFEAVVEDDRGDPATATQVAQKLVDMKVNGIVGHLTSGTTIPAARIYNDAGLPQVAPSATNPRYTQLDYKFAVRLMATDLQQATGIAEFAAKTLGARTAAIIDDRTAYGQGLADQVAIDMAKAGLKVLKREYTTDRATDFTAILTSIRAAKPDVLVYAGADAQAGPLNRQMKQLGIAPKFIAGDGVCTGEWSMLAEGTNEGAYCTQAGARQDAMNGFASFAKRFKARNGVDVVVFAPYGYDAVMVLAGAMRAANSADPSVYGPFVPKTTLKGLIGTIRFDSKGDNPNAAVTVYEVRKGKLEAVL